MDLLADTNHVRCLATIANEQASVAVDVVLANHAARMLQDVPYEYVLLDCRSVCRELLEIAVADALRYERLAGNGVAVRTAK